MGDPTDVCRSHAPEEEAPGESIARPGETAGDRESRCEGLVPPSRGSATSGAPVGDRRSWRAALRMDVNMLTASAPISPDIIRRGGTPAEGHGGLPSSDGPSFASPGAPPCSPSFESRVSCGAAGPVKELTGSLFRSASAACDSAWGRARSGEVSGAESEIPKGPRRCLFLSVSNGLACWGVGKLCALLIDGL
jgi:hypothetical protein